MQESHRALRVFRSKHSSGVVFVSFFAFASSVRATDDLQALREQSALAKTTVPWTATYDLATAEGYSRRFVSFDPSTGAFAHGHGGLGITAIDNSGKAFTRSFMPGMPLREIDLSVGSRALLNIAPFVPDFYLNHFATSKVLASNWTRKPDGSRTFSVKGDRFGEYATSDDLSKLQPPVSVMTTTLDASDRIVRIDWKSETGELNATEFFYSESPDVPAFLPQTIRMGNNTEWSLVDFELVQDKDRAKLMFSRDGIINTVNYVDATAQSQLLAREQAANTAASASAPSPLPTAGPTQSSSRTTVFVVAAVSVAAIAVLWFIRRRK